MAPLLRSVLRGRLPRRALLLLAAALASPGAAAPADAQSFTVPGTSGPRWVDTGLDLAPGTLVQLTARGEVDVGAGWGRVGPEGATRWADVPGYPAETRHRYGLVARLTASRTDPNDDLREQWAYGERREYCAARGGRLWLTVNDDDPANNTGVFSVVVARAACPRPRAGVASGVRVYTARDRTYAPSRDFAAGEPVVLRVENHTGAPIHFLSMPTGREIYRGEDLVVQRLDGGRWSNAVNRIYIDESPVRCVELRPGMNTTRAWTPRTHVPGTYRVELGYTASAAECEVDPRSRPGVTRVHSESFQLSSGAAGAGGAAFGVAAVSAEAAVGPTATCPATVTFTGTIRATGAGTVRYQWERSDGSVSAPASAVFTAPGTRRVTRTWQVGGAGREVSGWQRLRVLSPGTMASEPAPFRFTCGSGR